MRAVVFEEFGAVDVLGVKEVDAPDPGPGEIRVVVRAAGVNPMDWKIRYGWMEGMVSTPLPAVPGLEVAGTVDQVGEGVSGFSIGDEVVGWATSGSYAQYALVGIAAHKPASLSWTQAVALPVAGETAKRVLGLLALREGETLLLHGAAGAVGSVAAQLAVALGATVVGTASAGNHDYLRGLGVVPVTYGEGLVARVRAAAPQGVDAVFDAAGHGALPDSVELRGTTDRIVTIADMAAQEHGVILSVGGTPPETQRADLAEHARLAAEGALRVQIADTFALADAAKAQEISESGHARGKLVIIP